MHQLLLQEGSNAEFCRLRASGHHSLRHGFTVNDTHRVGDLHVVPSWRSIRDVHGCNGAFRMSCDNI